MPDFCGSRALRPASDKMMSSVSYSCSGSGTCRSTGSVEDLDTGAQQVVLDFVGAGGQQVHAADGGDNHLVRSNENHEGGSEVAPQGKPVGRSIPV